MSVIGYVTLEEATAYIESHYIASDPLRVGWYALLDGDRSALLRKSFDTIEMLPFTGRKTSCDQTEAFPRNGSNIVPDAVKRAQIENALSLSDSSTLEDASFYQRLWQYGVNEYRIGNLSERISSGMWGSGLPAASGVVSAKAISYLKPFISGSYCIRRCRE